MLLHDVLQNDPGRFLLGIITVFPVLIWSVYLVWEMISGDIDTIAGLMGLAAAVIIGVAAVAPAFFRYLGVIAFASYASLIVVPLARRLQSLQEVKDYHIESLEKAYHTLGMKPGNPGLIFRIARILYDFGRTDAAIAVGGSVIENLSPRFFPDEHRQIRDWRHYASPTPPQAFVCPRCGYANKPGDVFCQKCAAPFFIDLCRGKTEASSLNGRMMSIWMAIIIIGLGIPACFTLFALPLAAAFTCLLVLLSLWALLWAFRGSHEVTG